MYLLTNYSGKRFLLVLTILASGLVTLITGVLVFQGYPAISEAGGALVSNRWNPAKGQYGMVPMVFGTLSVALLAILAAAPIGVTTAVCTAELVPERFHTALKSILEILAGIPSIVYGLIGVATLSLWVRDTLNLQTGRTIFTASVLLTVMILPIVITLVDDALRDVPDHYRASGRALGLKQYEVVTSILLPQVSGKIFSAILLALGRALGETMAVMLVIGSIDQLPDPLFNMFSPGQTITSKLGREVTGSAFGSLHFNVLMFAGALLLVVVLVLTFILKYFTEPVDRVYE